MIREEMSPHTDHDRIAMVEHESCLLCGTMHPRGAHLEFVARPDGGIEAEFFSSDYYQGYRGLLHGGVISALLDAAMTHCLFARGLVALTADLRVRFRKPVPLGSRMLLRAFPLKSHPPLHVLQAALLIGDEVYASAEGKFIERHEGQHDEQQSPQEFPLPPAELQS